MINLNTDRFSTLQRKNTNSSQTHKGLMTETRQLNNQTQQQVSFTGLLSFLFKRKPPLEELQELAKLAHRNSRPLFLMVNYGELAGYEEKAILILEAEKNRTKYTAIKEDFDSIIDILKRKDYESRK